MITKYNNSRRYGCSCCPRCGKSYSYPHNFSRCPVVPGVTHGTGVPLSHRPDPPTAFQSEKAAQTIERQPPPADARGNANGGTPPEARQPLADELRRAVDTEAETDVLALFEREIPEPAAEEILTYIDEAESKQCAEKEPCIDPDPIEQSNNCVVASEDVLGMDSSKDMRAPCGADDQEEVESTDPPPAQSENNPSMSASLPRELEPDCPEPDCGAEMRGRHFEAPYEHSHEKRPFSKKGLFGRGLLYYRKWWERYEVDIHVNGELLTGIPIFKDENTLRVVNGEHSYFIPLEKVDYIRTADGLNNFPSIVDTDE